MKVAVLYNGQSRLNSARSGVNQAPHFSYYIS